jgi:glycosyltransferase involved in cell wall biosynthesis
MKILVFGHMYTEPIHREKFCYLNNFGGFEITVITPTLWKHTLADYKFKPQTAEEKFKIVACPVSLSGNYYWFSYRGIWRILNEYNPDLVEIDQEPASCACFTLIKNIKRLAKRPKIVVWTSEDTRDKWPFLLGRYEHYSLSNIDHIIACNSEVERLLRKKGYKNAVSVFQFLGINPQIFKTQEEPTLRKELSLDNCFVLGYAGRLTEGKGLKTLLKSLPRLEASVKLLIVGQGELLNELKTLAEELGVRERVIFTGAVKHKEVVHYLNCMQILILPSEGTKFWQEKFGYVLAQAMLCGVAVIGAHSGGIPDVVGDCGLLFEPGDEKDLSQKIEILRNDKNLREHYIAKAKRRALDNYTVEKVAEKLAKVYRELK